MMEELNFDQSYYKSTILDRPNLYTNKLTRLLKVNPKKIRSKNIDWKMATAFAMQFCAEEIAIHLIKEIGKKTKNKNLVVSGGFFMNSVFNGKILDLTKFKKLICSLCSIGRWEQHRSCFIYLTLHI